MTTILTIEQDDGTKKQWAVSDPEFILMNGWRAVVTIAPARKDKILGVLKDVTAKPIECVGGGSTPDAAHGQAIQDAYNRARSG